MAAQDLPPIEIEGSESSYRVRTSMRTRGALFATRFDPCRYGHVMVPVTGL